MATKSRRWGNALGGWKRQPRKRNGQFGTGGASLSKKKKGSSSSAPRKKMSKRKKKAIAVGVVAGVAAVGATAYALEHRAISREFARQGGGVTTRDLGNGISVTSVSQMKRMAWNLDLGSIDRAMNGKNTATRVAGGVGIVRPSLRPQIETTHHLHRGGEALGYMQDVTVGRKVKAEAMYLRPESRGERRTVSAMSGEIKRRNVDTIASGRKIVVSKYRSEDSERIVRNQARQLGASNVKVLKRYNPSSGYTANITKSMDKDFALGGQRSFDRAKSKARQVGVLI